MSDSDESGEILILGIVKGLVASGEKVRKAFDDYKPDAVAVSISKEGLMAMVEHVESGAEMAEMENLEEEYYVAALERFGEVRKPPPSFVASWELCEKLELPLYPVDFDDLEFTELYCSYVSGVEWLRQPSKQREITRKRFTAKTAEEFVLEWDELVNGTKGMRKMERSREEKISNEVATLGEKYERVLLVVDYERMDAIRETLETADCSLSTLEF